MRKKGWRTAKTSLFQTKPNSARQLPAPSFFSIVSFHRPFQSAHGSCNHGPGLTEDTECHSGRWYHRELLTKLRIKQISTPNPAFFHKLILCRTSPQPGAVCMSRRFKYTPRPKVASAHICAALIILRAGQIVAFTHAMSCELK